MNASRGFTLIELLIVLALMGLASALVGPPALRSVERWRAAADFRATQAALQQLPLMARSGGKRLTFEETNAEFLRLDGVPPSVELRVIKTWSVAPDGTCTAGEVQAVRGGAQRTMRLVAPYCRVDWSDA